MKRIIVITSGKGGVGKTTTAVNLGAAINIFGKNVLVVDGNLTTPNIGIFLGSPDVPVSLNHVLNGKAEVFEAVYEHESGMKILPASLSLKELDKIKPDNLKGLKKDLTDIAEYVIVDSAAGLGIEARSAMDLADELIIVTNPELPAITDALKTIKLAEKAKKPILGVIVTRVRGDKIEMRPELVKEMLETHMLGMVPEDKSIQKALNLKNPVVHTHPKSHASRAYKEIASQIVNIPYKTNKEKENFFSRFIKSLGLKK